MKHLSSAAGLTVLAFALGSSAGPAAAQTAVTHATLQHAALPAAAGSAHRLFGYLQAASGPLLTIQLRSGRLVHVDASQAFALKRVSAPLYRNKPTVLEGTFAPSGTFMASVVKRAASRPVSWGLDR